MEYAIEINNLIKRYGNFTAINNLSIHVPVGKVYAFLGKNGSGKTTTIRVIMGLVKANQGSIKIFGTEINTNRRNVIKCIGAIVESPGAYDNLTTYENLMITTRMQKVSKTRVDEVLHLVGLSEVRNKRVGKLSLGMKQRLGIANALIHSPRILILDEPTNGLDPEGIRELRIMIRNLSECLGITVLISSHLLSEMEQIADYVGIMHQGCLLEECSNDLLNADKQSYVQIETNNDVETKKILTYMNLDFLYEINNKTFKVFCDKCENHRINYELVRNDISIFNLSSVNKNLEEKFLTLTEDKMKSKGI